MKSIPEEQEREAADWNAERGTDQAVTKPFCDWLDKMRGNSGVGANEAWNAGVAYARAERQDSQALPEQPSEVAEHGELDPRIAQLQSRAMARYVEGFTADTIKGFEAKNARQFLANALDHLYETAAMLGNMADRVTTPSPTQAAEARKPLTLPAYGEGRLYLMSPTYTGDAFTEKWVREAFAAHGIGSQP